MNFDFSLEPPKINNLNQADIDSWWSLCRDFKEKLNSSPKNSSIPPLLLYLTMTLNYHLELLSH